MTTAFTADVTIRHEPELVWQTLTDWPRSAEWMPGVEDARADGPTAEGTALTFVARGKERMSRVIAVEPVRTLVLRSVQGGVTADYRYLLHPVDGGTRVGLTADVTASGVWRLLGPVIRGAIRRADAGQLDALDRAVDARSASS